jgi:hypothetical protein
MGDERYIHWCHGNIKIYIQLYILQFFTLIYAAIINLCVFQHIIKKHLLTYSYSRTLTQNLL